MKLGIDCIAVLADHDESNGSNIVPDAVERLCLPCRIICVGCTPNVMRLVCNSNCGRAHQTSGVSRFRGKTVVACHM